MRRTDTLRPKPSLLFRGQDDNRGWRHFGFRHDQHKKELTSDFYLDGLAGKDSLTIKESAADFLVKGSTGRDTITASGKVTDATVKGDKEEDTLLFENNVTDSSIYGGKDNDTLTFTATKSTITGGLVSGDGGNDLIQLDQLVAAKIKGGAGADTVELDNKFSSSSIYGGAGNDSVEVTAKGSDSLIKLDADDDILNVGATAGSTKIGSTKIKGNQGDDSITLRSSLTGKGYSVYGGKDEDTIRLQSELSILISGDAGDDVISSTGGTRTATVLGADGDDNVDFSNANADSAVSIKGGKGDDVLSGSDGKDTIYGGRR